MRTAKIGALFVVSVMALAATGAAYALWYDELHLDIDVDTGEIEWVYTSIVCLDLDYGIPDYHCNPGFVGGYFWMGDKDVGWAFAELIDDHTARVELHNV